MGTFTSLNIAASGMRAARAALEIISNNIANANTPGFKRQMPVIVEGNPPTSAIVDPSNAALFSGTGVQVTGIRRIQDAFLDNQITNATQGQAQWTAARDQLSAIQSQFAEPGPNGVQELLTGFWNNWRDLAANPTSLSARVSVASQADMLSTRIRGIYSNLGGLQNELDATVTNRVSEINRIANDIAAINEKIVAMQVGGAAPNDLLDSRDVLVEKLSKIVSVTAHGNSGPDFILNIGGVTLVQGTDTRTVNTRRDANGHIEAYWDDNLGPISITSGELKGVLLVRDSLIPDYMARLDTIATTLVTQVNAVHKTGYGMNGSTGVNFFTPGTSAANISVNAAVLNDKSLVAASANGEESNTTTAETIVGLADTPLINGESINDSYRTLVSKLGGEVSIAERNAQTRDYTLQQLTNQRNSISGVSLDDEMVDMVRFQQAFGASARVFEATNYLLTTLIEQTAR